ncbi:alpha/beta hydrolase [Cellulomonas xylanilytica]|nr:alpha/beta hydrolase [Cellulomonas xylanilytica]
MTALRRTGGLALLTTALLATTLAAPPALAAGAPAQVDAPVPVLDWQPCGPGLEPFLCTSAEVPRDYDRPNGATTTIALTLLPASGDPAERVGTLFTNPGGPGGSGVEFVQQAGPYIYHPDVLARFDVLGFDPRAVAGSDPATCFRTAEDEASSPLLAQAYPITPREEVRYTLESLALATRCQVTSPVRFATASTANVARDMDLLRQAVGDEELYYAGYSYGTFLGATYARLFPERVGRFLLDATVDPVAWTGTGAGDAAPSVPLGIRIRQGLGAHETFGEFTRLCAEAGPATCPLAALGDPATVAYETFDRLATQPVEVPLPDGTSVLVTQQVAVASTFQSLYSPSLWPDLAALIAALAAPVPDPAAVASAGAGTRSALGARLRGEDYPSIGGGLASLCVDTASNGRVDRYPRLIDAYDQTAPYFGRFRGWVALPCETWPIQDHDAFTGPWQQTTTAPVLVVGTRFDPATPYQQTQPYRDLFPAGHLLTLDGWGHTALGKSVCVDEHIATYLVTGAPPADGTVCAPDAVPFATAPGARVAPRIDVPPGLPFW